MAHEKMRQATPHQDFAETPDQALLETSDDALVVETLGQTLEAPLQADDMVRQMATTLEAREAEISSLRDLLHHGVATIESHTLMDSDGTVVMHGDYQCISATAIEQWLERAEAALHPTRRSAERARAGAQSDN
jgi:hypothetical protein